MIKKPFILKVTEIIRNWRLPETPPQESIEYPKLQAALETINLYKNYIHIYTDGSKKKGLCPQQVLTG